jgi:hypothetical protein
MIQASSRRAIQYTLAALIAFAGGAVLLKGTAIALGAPGGTVGAGLLSYVVAALLALTGAVLIAMAAAELVHAHRPLDGSRDPARHRGG